MEYTAKFGIDGGESPGFGVKYPDYIEKIEKINAESDAEAITTALKMAREYSKDHLSNPNTEETAVTLMYVAEKGRVLDQATLVDKTKVELSNGCAVVKCSTLEHLLLLMNEK